MGTEFYHCIIFIEVIFQSSRERKTYWITLSCILQKCSWLHFKPCAANSRSGILIFFTCKTSLIPIATLNKTMWKKYIFLGGYKNLQICDSHSYIFFQGPMPCYYWQPTTEPPMLKWMPDPSLHPQSVWWAGWASLCPTPEVVQKGPASLAQGQAKFENRQMGFAPPVPLNFKLCSWLLVANISNFKIFHIH